MALVFRPIACCDCGAGDGCCCWICFWAFWRRIYGEKRRHQGLGGSVLMIGEAEASLSEVGKRMFCKFQKRKFQIPKGDCLNQDLGRIKGFSGCSFVPVFWILIFHFLICQRACLIVILYPHGANATDAQCMQTADHKKRINLLPYLQHASYVMAFFRPRQSRPSRTRRNQYRCWVNPGLCKMFSIHTLAGWHEKRWLKEWWDST